MKRLRAWLYIEYWLLIDKIKPYLKPTMLISMLLAWMITNGWAYIFAIIGTPVMRKIALGYIALLWLPFTPEKVITIPIGLFIQKILFNRKKVIYEG